MGPRRVIHTHTHTLSLPLCYFLYFLSKVVEVHLEELWGFKLESPDCAPPPLLSHRSSLPPLTPTAGLFPVVKDGITCTCRFADVLQTLGRSVAFIGKRADVALSLSNQVWRSSDKEVSFQLLKVSFSSPSGVPHSSSGGAGASLIQESNQACVPLRAPAFILF